MTDTTDTTVEAPPIPEPDAPEWAEDQAAEFNDADREKMSEVIRKERAAAKSAGRRAEEAERRLAELEVAEMRRTVAAEYNLNPAQAEFLAGDNPEEMAEAAERLVAAFERPRNPLHRRPTERVPRSGATGATLPTESVSDLADRVLK